jgi:hypothetical protein
MSEHKSADQRCLCSGHSSEASTAGWGPNPCCPIHGNHPSNIEPLTDIGDCDNRRQSGRDLDDC